MRHFAISRLLVIFAAALLAGGPVAAQYKAAVKRHQATGTVSPIMTSSVRVPRQKSFIPKMRSSLA